jgi:hypothetical protein
MSYFAPGKTYRLTFIGDADLHVAWKVLKRTRKFVTITDGNETKRVGVRLYCGVEQCLPFGSYSMSPVLAADRETDREPGTYTTHQNHFSQSLAGVGA